MSSLLNDIPELRKTFQTDSSALVDLITEKLAGLNQAVPDFSTTTGLRNTIHSLRGAAAMVGAISLSALIDDCERLMEVAESFKHTAPEKARQIYGFFQNQLGRLRETLQAVLAGQDETAKECYNTVHREAMALWGDYFYLPTPNTQTSMEEKSTPKVINKSAGSAGKSGARHADPDAVARDFLTSLGMSQTAAPTPAPVPVTDELAVLEQFDPEMLSYFVMETNDSLAQIEGLLLTWEKTTDDSKIAQSIFRLVHTIKGAANSLGLVRIGRLLHGLEDMLETHVVDRIYPNLTELVEVILGVSDAVKAFVRECQNGVAESSSVTLAASLSERIQRMANAPLPPLRSVVVEPPPPTPVAVAAPAQAAPIPEAPPQESLFSEALLPTLSQVEPEAVEQKTAGPEKADAIDLQTIRVESDRLDLLMNLIGELVISRSRLEKKLTDISRLKEEMFFGKARLFQAITDFQGKYEYSRPTVERNRLAAPAANPAIPTPEATILSGFSELEFDQYDEFNILARTLMEIGTDTGEIFSQLNRFFDTFGEETGQFSKITSRLQDEITRVRMMPLTLLFQRLRRSARDASRKEKKEINFVTVDNDARLDKLILDQLYTPLLHIVRNAVSHGIESPAARAAAGKPAAGQINLRAICEANHVVIEVSDDGRGLDFSVIRETAIRKGMLSADATVDEDTLTQFVFQPGFSTAASVTDVSGRGVGLDVVRQEIARLSGSIQVRSVPGRGCIFIIHLPLTLAINQAMFITVGEETCALPLNFVERILEGHESDFVRSGDRELIRTPEGMVPLVSLHHLLNVAPPAAGLTVVLARVADRRIAIGVDRILRKQDIVVKPVGPLLRGHPLFSGATLGGDGQVVMILDLPRLLENEQPATLHTGSAGRTGVTTPDSARPTKPTILVVDDSLSVRKVIEKHLVSCQFDVELAVDGLDALEKLRSHPISLVLTDLEMPRMHGFELVAEMRRSESFRLVPVIVVTSRDAEKHRRRATSLGANGYIIKPFSREQLVENIKQLLSEAKS